MSALSTAYEGKSLFLREFHISPHIVRIFIFWQNFRNFSLHPEIGNFYWGLPLAQIVGGPAGEVSDDGVVTAGDLEDVEVV